MTIPNLAIDAASLVADKTQMKRAGAAKDFEALLVGQMLRSVREEGSGWLGTGDDQASSSAFGLGEEQLARALTNGGGLGLARVIEAGLKNQAGAVGGKPQAEAANRPVSGSES